MSQTTSASLASMDQHTAPGSRVGTRLRGWLTAGTSHLATLTALGGLLIFLAYAIGGWRVMATSTPATGQAFSWLKPDSWSIALLQSGNSILDVLGLAVALYAAYGIARWPALIPAFAGGMAAVTMGTGYLGGLAAGVLAGLLTRALQRITVPDTWRSLTDRAVFPLLTALLTAGVFFSAIVSPVLAWFTSWLNGKLTQYELTGHHLLLGLVLGLLVCCDLGGALYKIAYGYALVGIEEFTPTPAHLTFMAVVMAAGMVPTMGLSLASAVRGKLFTPAERGYGKVAWMLGLVAVPEGVIPFAVRDPLRVIPASMAGGAVTGVLTVAFGAGISVPHAGFLAFSQIDKPLLFAAAIAAGTLVTAGVAIALKSLTRAEVPATANTPTLKARKKVLAAN
ncbi:fructose-specific PTS transporter subunit EIIC [Streptomyces sp. NPDC088196]|uniref:fructose-specific PTS transporter subunit EIIC n=1 Tax=Streptomyces sp. NPDC088196 TaxID=3154868 RepID=UPI00344E27F6